MASIVRLAIFVNVTKSELRIYASWNHLTSNKVATGVISDPGADNNRKYLLRVVEWNLTYFAVLTTRGLYWSILESGLALIACCLPLLNALGRLPALQSAMRSIRSLSLLHSSGSRTQDSNKRNDTDTFNRLHERGDISMDSTIAFAQDRNEHARYEAFARADSPNIAHIGPGTASGNIWVDEAFERREITV